jgi:retinol dehydrogenase-12
VEQIDLADLKSVRQFADKMNKKLDKLDVLINNAGVMQCPYWRTKDNFELQFGTNHLAHFLLSHLLLDLLEKNKSSRIINVSSIAHVFGQINWDDINCEFEKDYSPLARYNQSKLANVLFAYEASQRFKNIISVSLHPGLVRTDIMRHAELGGSATISLGFISKLFFPFWYIVSKSAWEGAQTTLHCALDDSVLNYNGYYFA